MVARYTVTIAASIGKLFTLTHINFAFATNSAQDKVRGGCQGAFLSNVNKKKKKKNVNFLFKFNLFWVKNAAFWPHLLRIGQYSGIDQKLKKRVKTPKSSSAYSNNQNISNNYINKNSKWNTIIVANKIILRWACS